MRLLFAFWAASIFAAIGVTLAKQPRKLSPEEQNGNDIVYRPGQRNANRAAKRWSNAEVPYVIESGLSDSHVRAINRAIQTYNQLTCIRLVPKMNHHNDYIRFMDGRSCSSYVGRQGGSQDLSLGSGCLSPGIVLHEIAHALGFDHEQNRPDRDDFVTVRSDRIIPSVRFAFDKLGPSQAGSQSLRYDYLSVMHYGRKFFSENDDDTIITLDKTYQNQIGQRSKLSECDLEKINRHYECNDYIQPSNPCGIPTAGSQQPTRSPRPRPKDTTDRPTTDTSGFVEAGETPSRGPTQLFGFTESPFETPSPGHTPHMPGGTTTLSDRGTTTTFTYRPWWMTATAPITTGVPWSWLTTSAPSSSCDDEPSWKKWCEYFINRKPQLCEKSAYKSKCKKSCMDCEKSEECRDDAKMKQSCLYYFTYGYIIDHGCSSGRELDSRLTKYCPETCGLC